MGVTASLSLFAGQVSTPWADKAPSAIGKSPCADRVRLTKTGLVVDAQADLEAHGGFEKALHHYPADHYTAWSADLGKNKRFRPGGFGENISTHGITEEDVCIGDVFSIGSARVQINQGRQPCWKLAAHTGEDRMAYLVRKTLRTGWYYRVLEEGDVATGDSIALLERDPTGHTVKEVTQAFFNPRLDPDTARKFAAIETLFPGWRDSFVERAG